MYSLVLTGNKFIHTHTFTTHIYIDTCHAHGCHMEKLTQTLDHNLYIFKPVQFKDNQL